MSCHYHERDGRIDDDDIFTAGAETHTDVYIEDEEDVDPRLCAAFIVTAMYVLHSSNGFKADDISLTLDVDLEDLYAPVTKRVTYAAFDADGRRVRKKIRVCLADWKEEYVFEGRGDKSPFDNMAPGNVIVRLNVLPHPVFHIDSIFSKYDIICTVPVTLYDYYYGRRVFVCPPSPKQQQKRRRYYVAYDHEASRSRQSVIRGAGLPMCCPPELHAEKTVFDRGDIYVFFEIRLPEIPRPKLGNFMTRLFIRSIFGRRSSLAEEAERQKRGEGDEEGRGFLF
jgi:hypothetical protein